MQGALQPELEQRVVAREGACGRIRFIDNLTDRLLVDASCPSRHIKLIVHLGVRKGVQSKAPIAAQVMDLRRVVADEDIQAAVGNDRTDRMDTRTTVLTERGQIA